MYVAKLTHKCSFDPPHHLQRKAELKRNIKREKREQEKKQALAALEAASPRATGRPKKSGASDLFTRERTPGGTSTGPNSPSRDETPFTDTSIDIGDLVDPLAHRCELPACLHIRCSDHSSCVRLD